MSDWQSWIGAGFWYSFIMCFVPGPWNGRRNWKRGTR